VDRGNTTLSKIRNNHIPSEILFISGLLVLPTFLFQTDLVIRSIQVLFFLSLYLISGKKIKVLPLVSVSFGIFLFNFLSPQGKILFRIFNFPITKGAFIRGADRTVTVVGLIYVSRLTIRSDLRLPGRIGTLISAMFLYFEKLMETRIDFKKPKVFRRIDRLLADVYASIDWGGNPGDQISENHPVRSFRGYLLPVLFAAVNWVLFFLKWR
jgi:hypothetical protein